MGWEEFTRECHHLGDLIKGDFDITIAVARGGVIPATLLSKQLSIKDMLVFKVRREGDKRIIVGEIMTDLSGKKVLLVEDTLESGASLQAAKKYIEEGGAEVTTACLYTLPQTKFKPDFSLGNVETIPTFPWE